VRQQTTLSKTAFLGCFCCFIKVYDYILLHQNTPFYTLFLYQKREWYKKRYKKVSTS